MRRVNPVVLEKAQKATWKKQNEGAEILEKKKANVGKKQARPMGKKPKAMETENEGVLLCL